MTVSRIGDPAARRGQRTRQVAQDKYDVHKVYAVMLREMGIGQCSMGSNL